MSDKSKASRQGRIRKVEAGMSKYYGTVPSVRLAGIVYTSAELVQVLEADIAASDAADLAKAAFVKAVNAQGAAREKTNPVLRAIRHLVLSDHGDTKDASDVLAIFGYSARKPYKASGEQQVAAADKARATRKARHTMGSRQKKAVTGSSEPVTAETPSK